MASGRCAILLYLTKYKCSWSGTLGKKSDRFNFVALWDGLVCVARAWLAREARARGALSLDTITVSSAQLEILPAELCKRPRN